MAKTPEKPRRDETAPSEDDVLRRMLNTPPKPHKPKPYDEAVGKKKPKKKPSTD